MKRKKAAGPGKKSEIGILIQTKIPKDIHSKFTRLARSTSRSNAGYLRALITAHVKAIDPKVTETLSRIWHGQEDKDVLKEDAP
jgi:predicted DNA-binding protein